jgi:hypothetical protein
MGANVKSNVLKISNFTCSLLMYRKLLVHVGVQENDRHLFVKLVFCKLITAYCS